MDPNLRYAREYLRDAVINAKYENIQQFKAYFEGVLFKRAVDYAVHAETNDGLNIRVDIAIKFDEQGNFYYFPLYMQANI